MKFRIHILCFLLFGILFSFCKKEKKEEQSIGITGPSLVVDSLRETTGNQKIFSVKLRDSNSSGKDTLVTAFTCTSTIIGDTTIQNGFPAKKYVFTFSHKDYPSIKAYSYLKNSTWFFVTLRSCSFIPNLSVHLPLVVGDRWNFHHTSYDTLSVEKILEVSTAAGSDLCYKINVLPAQDLWNFNTYIHSYYINKKGMMKHTHGYITEYESNSGWSQLEYEVSLISSNF